MHRVLAVDINPVQNPWVKGNEVDPVAGRPFDTVPKRQAAQNRGQPGIILGGGAAVAAFKAQRLDLGRRLAQREGLSALFVQWPLTAKRLLAGINF